MRGDALLTASRSLCINKIKSYRISYCVAPTIVVTDNPVKGA